MAIPHSAPPAPSTSARLASVRYDTVPHDDDKTLRANEGTLDAGVPTQIGILALSLSLRRRRHH